MLYAHVTGTYLFRIDHDDGAKLVIAQKRAIDYWHPYNYNNHEANLFLEGGRWHQIKVEFFEITGRARVKLLWRQPGTDNLEVISSSYLKLDVQVFHHRNIETIAKSEYRNPKYET